MTQFLEFSINYSILWKMVGLNTGTYFKGKEIKEFLLNDFLFLIYII